MSDVMIVKGSVTQSVADQTAVGVINTGLGVLDQKTLWELIGWQVQWSHAWIQQPKAGFIVTPMISRKEDKTGFLDSEVISTLQWVYAMGVGMTPNPTTQIDMIKSEDFREQPWVANSQIYVLNASQATGQKNEIQYKLYYREKKVTELEFLKAQSGYCVC